MSNPNMISEQNELKAFKELKGSNVSKERKLKNKNFVVEFRKIKQEIEDEIKQEHRKVGKK